MLTMSIISIYFFLSVSLLVVPQVNRQLKDFEHYLESQRINNQYENIRDT